MRQNNLNLVSRSTGFEFLQNLFKSQVSTSRPIRCKRVKGLVSHVGDINLATTGLDISGGQLSSQAKGGVVTQQCSCGQFTSIYKRNVYENLQRDFLTKGFLLLKFQKVLK